MKIFKVAENAKCNSCLWNNKRLYLLASSKEEAEELSKGGFGLCAVCLVEMLIEHNWNVS